MNSLLATYLPTSTLGGGVGLGKTRVGSTATTVAYLLIIGTQPLDHFLRLTIPLHPWGMWGGAREEKRSTSHNRCLPSNKLACVKPTPIEKKLGVLSPVVREKTQTITRNSIGIPWEWEFGTWIACGHCARPSSNKIFKGNPE